MGDDAAFMQLVLANAQGELSPLERGMHALAATEKGKHNGRSIQLYAKQIRQPQQTVDLQVRAAKVASKLPMISNFADLSKRPSHLAEIHVAPEACWSAR